MTSYKKTNNNDSLGIVSMPEHELTTTSCRKINTNPDIYRISGPKTIIIDGKPYQRFMNFFYIPDYVYNLDENFVIALNNLRHTYRDIVIDYGYNAELEERIFSSISKIIDKKSCLKILDFGCGERNITAGAQILSNNVKLYGVDIRDIDVKYLRNYEKFEKITTNSKLSFENCFFDIIVAMFVFHFRITDTQITSLYNIVKKDGLFCFNLIKSADRSIINRLINAGFKMKEEIIEPFRDGKKNIEYYVMSK